MLTISDFTNLYPVSKTLRWALKPIGKTAHFINENHILENDRQKARTYEKAKKVLDEVYKDFINVALGSMEEDLLYILKVVMTLFFVYQIFSGPKKILRLLMNSTAHSHGFYR